ncbi:MAG: hypothetical protein ACRD8U_08160 [Pyrinomonadaceae bacterium]
MKPKTIGALIACLGVFMVGLLLALYDGATSTDATQTTDSYDVEDFAIEVIHHHWSQQYGPLYDKLHPLQQDMFTREQYMQCANEAARGGIITDEQPDLDIVTTYEEEMVIPGTVLKVNSTAVTIAYDSGLVNGRDTLHFVPDGDTWTWMLLKPEECEG